LSTPEDQPQVANEGVAVELETVVVGPPGYGSPDEQTAAGRLVSLVEHPLKEEISPFYGADVVQADVSLIVDAGEEVTEETQAQAAQANVEAEKVNKEAEAVQAKKAEAKVAKKTEGR
jgi:hypothetical protein